MLRFRFSQISHILYYVKLSRKQKKHSSETHQFKCNFDHILFLLFAGELVEIIIDNCPRACKNEIESITGLSKAVSVNLIKY